MPEALLVAVFYLGRDAGSVRSFVAHADRVGIVVPAWYHTDGSGVVSGVPDQIVLEAARKHGVPVMPIIANPDFHQATVHAMLSNPGARARVAQSLLEECRRHSYYGFQLDFENIPATDRENLTALVRDTAALLKTGGFRLSIAVMYQTSAERPAAGYQRWLWDHWLGAYDLREIARHVEFLSVMTYDQHTERTPPGPIAAYPWVEQVLDFYLQQAPKEKLSLGIPLYGRRWHTGLLRGEGSQAAASVNHHEALELAAQNHAAPIWDELERAPWFWFYRDGLREYVFYNDAHSFRERYDLARRRALHGFSAWVLGAEDPEIWKALPARAANPRE